MGRTRDLWNTGYPSLTTPTPFKSQSAGFKFTLTKRRLTTSDIPILGRASVQPAFPTPTQFTPILSPLPSLTFDGPPPELREFLRYTYF